MAKLLYIHFLLIVYTTVVHTIRLKMAYVLNVLQDLHLIVIHMCVKKYNAMISVMLTLVL